MKRTDRLTNIIAFLLFAAFVAYLAVYAANALSGTTVTAEAVGVELELSGVATGIVVRDEIVLTSDEPYIDVTVKEGAKVAGGSVLATAMQDEEGLKRARQMHELEREISRVSMALSELRANDDLTGREASKTSAAHALAAAVARHDTSAMDSATLSLEGLLLGVDAGEITEYHLTSLQRQLTGLRQSAIADEQVLTAEAPGLFSSLVDGFEHIGSADLEGLTPSGLQALMESGEEPAANAFGKLVSSYQWYFAAAMSVVDASNLVRGKTATLNFGRWYSLDIPARVVSVSPSEDGKVVVVFRSDSALADTLSMRSASANVIFDSYSGIRIPAQAVRVDEEKEKTYVWTVTAMQLERKEIEIVYASGDYVIVRRSPEAGALREGNTVVVSGKDLKEGKIME